MLNLIQNEFKKILNIKSFIFSAIVLILTCSFIFLNSINQNNQYADTSGIQAIADAKEKKKELNGELNQKDLQNCVTIYLNIINNKENFDSNGNINIVSKEDRDNFIKYADLADLLTRVYSPLGTYDANIFNEIDKNDINTNIIFENRKKNIDKIVNTNYSDQLSSNHIFEYNYTVGWQSLFKDIGGIQLIILIITTILISPVFSREYKFKLIPILYSSKYGKTKDITAKILCSTIIVTLLYFVPIICYSIIKLYIFGFDGYNSYLQTTSAYWLSLYPISFLEAYLYIVLSGYLATLSTMSLCMLISKFSKKESLSIIINLMMILLPVILSKNIILKPLLDFMPSNMIGDANLLLNFELIYLFETYFRKTLIIEIIMIVTVFLVIIYLKKSHKSITI